MNARSQRLARSVLLDSVCRGALAALGFSLSSSVLLLVRARGGQPLLVIPSGIAWGVASSLPVCPTALVEGVPWGRGRSWTREIALSLASLVVALAATRLISVVDLFM